MDKMTDPACAGLKEYTYAKHRCNFGEWLCSKGPNIFESQYKEVWEGTNTNAKDLFDLAAWAAAKAAQMGTGIWLTNDEVYEILEATGFYEIAEKGAEGLPDPNDFDAQHFDWCKKVLEEVRKVAKRRGGENWKHGRAAKLINIFLKTVMLCKYKIPPAEKKKAKWFAVHPPIDNVVLRGMQNAGIGYLELWGYLPGGANKFDNGGAFKFEYKHYREVICMILRNLRECGYEDPLPLWKNERFFKS